MNKALILLNPLRKIFKDPTVLILMGFVLGFALPFKLFLFILFGFFLYKRTIGISYFFIAYIAGFAFISTYYSNIDREIKQLNPNQIELKVKIIEPPIKYDYSQTIIANAVGLNSNLLLNVDKYEDYKIYETIAIKGNLEAIESNNKITNGYKKYLESKNIYFSIDPETINKVNRDTSLFELINDFKVSIISIINKNTKEPNSSLINGILLGEKSTFEKELKDKITVVGISHIVAASGFNILIAFQFSDKFLYFIPTNKRKVVGLTISLLIFLLIGTYNFSAFRAFIMIGLMTIGKLLGRNITNLKALLLSMAIILSLNPFAINNISFQLSVLASFAIFIVEPYLSELLFNNSKSYINNTISISLSITILTFPVILINFGAISLINVFANLLILPLIPILAIVIIGALITFPIAEFISLLLFYISFLLSEAIIRTIEILYKFNFLYISNPISILLVSIFLFLVLIYFYVQKKRSNIYNINSVY